MRLPRPDPASISIFGKSDDHYLELGPHAFPATPVAIFDAVALRKPYELEKLHQALASIR